MPTSNRYVLDTHVWLWWVMGHSGINAQTLASLAAASENEGLLVSVISVWEVGLLAAKGRIELGMAADKWVERALAVPGLRLCHLTPAIAVRSSFLPMAPHGDPADRIIMATALAEGVPLVTRDQAILAYGAQGHLSVIPA
jgi:PIN domain nuclease of toxin-antitoxin system